MSLHTIAKRCRTLGLTLIWASVVLIAYGTYLRAVSPQSDVYDEQIVRDIINQNPRRDLAPGIGIGIVLMNSWWFMGVFSGFIALVFTVGVTFLPLLGQWNRDLGILLAGMFGCGCLLGMTMGLATSLDPFLWGFCTLGVGYLFSAGGLAFGCVSVIGLCLTTGSRRRPEAGRA